MASSSTVEVDEELRKAAKEGDVEFLRRCVADNKPNQYYLTVFPPDDYRLWYGNMFHIAALEEREEFIREVIEGNLLPLNLVQQLLCQPLSESKKDNPLHIAARRGNVKIVKLFLNAFNTPLMSPPWLMINQHGSTPCHEALDSYGEEIEECGLEILRMDKEKLSNMFDYRGRSLLYIAVENGMDNLAIEILTSPHPFSASGEDGRNAWNLIAKHRVSEFFTQQLLMKLVDSDKGGNFILNRWVKIGKLWPFERLLNDYSKHRRRFVDHMSSVEHTSGKNNLLHVASTLTYEAIPQAVNIFIEAFKLEFPDWKSYAIDSLPWCKKNEDDEGALHLAIRFQRDQKLALLLLSLHQNKCDYDMEEWLDYYTPKEYKILYLAIENNFVEVVKTIISRLKKANRTKYLQDSSSGNNVLHIALTCTSIDYQLGQWLVEKAPDEFITHPDMTGMTPLELACDVGAAKIVSTMLEIDYLSAFEKVPLAWVKACKNGHVSVIQSFVDCSPEKFSDHCLEHQDTPLHHIKLRNVKRYEDFLKIQYMKDLINAQDSHGATPLHKAIENRNIQLAEALLNMDKIQYNIKDDSEKTAKDLLAQLCNEDRRWNQMCQNIGFDPNLTTSYFQRRTDLLEVRNTLSVVAALLATITFTAGFTLPGGLNQETGEAMMVNKAMFAVFLLSDTLAMCFSMVVLICLIWSMVFDPSQSLYLIDRSVGLLKISLYLTLLAFVTGVFIVIYSKYKVFKFHLLKISSSCVLLLEFHLIGSSCIKLLLTPTTCILLLRTNTKIQSTASNRALFIEGRTQYQIAHLQAPVIKEEGELSLDIPGGMKIEGFLQFVENRGAKQTLIIVRPTIMVKHLKENSSMCVRVDS